MGKNNPIRHSQKTTDEFEPGDYADPRCLENLSRELLRGQSPDVLEHRKALPTVTAVFRDQLVRMSDELVQIRRSLADLPGIDKLLPRLRDLETLVRTGGTKGEIFGRIVKAHAKIDASRAEIETLTGLVIATAEAVLCDKDEESEKIELLRKKLEEAKPTKFVPGQGNPKHVKFTRPESF